MKNLPILISLLLLSLLLSACGRKEADPSSLLSEDQAQALQADQASAILPEPSNLLACPGFLSIADVQGDVQIGTATLLSSESVAVLTDFYIAQLASNGWTQGASIEQGGIQHLQFTQNGRFLRFQIAAADGSDGASIQIAWTQPASATEFTDARSPEPELEAPDPDGRGSIEW